MIHRLRPRIVAVVLSGLLLLSCGDPTWPLSAGQVLPILFIGRTGGPGFPLGPPGIYSVRADGSDLRLLTRGAGHALYPAWSRDGSQIAFASSPTGGAELWIMDADGSNPHNAGFPSCVYDYRSLTWAPTGDQLAAECFRDTQIFDLRSGQVRSLSTALGMQMADPDWSPTDDRMAFGSPFSTEVLAASADGQSPPTVLLGTASDPAWSPDGQHLAFVGGGAIHIARADGSGRRPLTHPDSAFDEGPTWSSDGRFLAFHRFRRLCAMVGTPPVETCELHWAVYSIRADGRFQRRLTPDSLLATRPAG
jgi:Tol biopolymer transport system component